MNQTKPRDLTEFDTLEDWLAENGADVAAVEAAAAESLRRDYDVLVEVEG